MHMRKMCWRDNSQADGLEVLLDVFQKKGTPVGVVYRAQGPALGSWEDRPPAA